MRAATAYPKRLLAGLYQTMLRIRHCEEALVDPILSGEIRCPVHLYSGEEAVAAGVCAALNKRDRVFGTHRSHGHYLAKGGSLDALMAEIFCRIAGCSRGKGGSMHLVAPSVGMMGSAPIVAGTISLALGAALASRIRRDGRVTVSFFGDGAAGEGVLYESLNFASLKRLPLIFLCENNGYSTHLPIAECRPNAEIFRIAAPFDIAAARVDGNDVLAVYEASREAVRRCRTGRGPYFLECATYRQRGHVGPDDNIQGCHTDIRPPGEIDAWKKRDPLRRFAARLCGEWGWTGRDLGAREARVAAEVRLAMERARRSRRPGKGELNRHVFKV